MSSKHKTLINFAHIIPKIIEIQITELQSQHTPLNPCIFTLCTWAPCHGDSVWNAHVEIVWYGGVILSLNSGNILNEQGDGQDLDTTGYYMDTKFVVSWTSCAS